MITEDMAHQLCVKRVETWYIWRELMVDKWLK